MEIPTGWNYLATEYGDATTTAFLHTPDFTLQVTHKTRDTTVIRVMEPGTPEGYDFENTDRQIEWGAHRNPAAAFKFAAVYLTRTEDFRPGNRGRLSARYSAAVDEAYARA